MLQEAKAKTKLELLHAALAEVDAKADEEAANAEPVAEETTEETS